MKTFSANLKCTAAILAMAFVLVCGGCNAAELSSLRSFAKPYAGAYVCTEARFGGRDLLQEYPSVTLTLSEDGTCVLEATSSGGRKRTACGRYEYNGEDSILFSATVRGRKFTKNAAIERGCFVIEQQFAGQKLFLKFESKT